MGGGRLIWRHKDNDLDQIKKYINIYSFPTALPNSRLDDVRQMIFSQQKDTCFRNNESPINKDKTSCTNDNVSGVKCCQLVPLVSLPSFRPWRSRGKGHDFYLSALYTLEGVLRKEYFL